MIQNLAPVPFTLIPPECVGQELAGWFWLLSQIWPSFKTSQEWETENGIVSSLNQPNCSEADKKVISPTNFWVSNSCPGGWPTCHIFSNFNMACMAEWWLFIAENPFICNIFFDRNGMLSFVYYHSSRIEVVMVADGVRTIFPNKIALSYRSTFVLFFSTGNL